MSDNLFLVSAAVVALFGCAALVLRPKLVVYFFLALLIFFQIFEWGADDHTTSFNLYARGTGMLPIPLFDLYLYVMFAASMVIWHGNKSRQPALLFQNYLWIFGLLFVCYVLYGLFLGIPPAKIISHRGVINIVSMSLLLFVLIRAFPSKQDANRLATFLVACAVVRESWGLVRFLMLGGDPVNPYQRYQQLDITLSFYDIGDSVVACLSGYYAAWMLTWNRRNLSNLWRAFYGVAFVLAMFTIIFSYRRAAWGGLALAGLHFAWLQPWRRKIILIPVAAVLGVAMASITAYRFTLTGEGNQSGLLYDVIGEDKVALETGRFRELYYTLLEIRENPILGVGPWGGYGPDKSMDFMHSGILHVWLKTGFIGLFILVACLFSWWRFVRTARHSIPPEARGLYEAGFATLLFLSPTFLIATSVTEMRTMQLAGLAMALPCIIALSYHHKNETRVFTEPVVPLTAVSAKSTGRFDQYDVGF